MWLLDLTLTKTYSKAMNKWFLDNDVKVALALVKVFVSTPFRTYKWNSRKELQLEGTQTSRILKL